MTNLAAALETAHSERNRFIAFAFAFAELVVEANEDGDILFAAGATKSMFGISNDKLTGKNLYQLIEVKDRAGLRKALASLPLGKKMKSRTVMALTPTGPPRALRAGAYRMPNNPGVAYISISLHRPDNTTAETARRGRNAVGGYDIRHGQFSDD